MKQLLMPFRLSTLDNWKDSNYIPRPNEVLCAMVTPKEAIYKLGDGIHKWNDLQERTFSETLMNGKLYSDEYVITFARGRV